MTWIFATKDSEEAISSSRTVDKIFFIFPSDSLFLVEIIHQNLFLGNTLLLAVLRVINPENTNIYVEGFLLRESQFSIQVCKFS